MKKTNGWALTLFLVLTLWSSSSRASRDDLATLFDEDTLLYLELPSIPQLKDDWKANPFYELYQREEVKEFIRSLFEALKEEEEFKRRLDELMGEFSEEEDGPILEGLLSGQIAVGISRLDFLSILPDPTLTKEQNAARKPRPTNFWIVFDHEDEEMKAKLVADMEEEEDEYIEYEDFYIILADQISVAYNDDIVAVTNSEETAKTFVDRYLQRDSRPTLADRDAFQHGFSLLYENSEIFYFVDLSAIGEVAEQAAEKYGEVSYALVQSGRLAPNETILGALGLDTFRGLSGAVDLDPVVLKSRSNLQLEPNEGFFGKLFSHYGYSLPNTRFLSEDLRQITAMSFDISGVLHDLEKAVSMISPFAGQMYQGQKAQFGQMLSMDIDQALTNNFSGSVYVAVGETHNSAAADLTEQIQGMETVFDQGSTFILGINDRLALESLIDSLLASFNQSGLINKQEYLGTSGYALKTQTPVPGPSLFIGDQHLLFEQSNPDFAKLMISMMQNPENLLFERRDIKDALNELPPNPIGITYNDAEKLMSFLSDMLKNMGAQFAQPPGQESEEANPFADLKIPVIEDFSYFTLGTNYKQDDDLIQELILRPKSD